MARASLAEKYVMVPNVMPVNENAQLRESMGDGLFSNQLVDLT